MLEEEKKLELRGMKEGKMGMNREKRESWKGVRPFWWRTLIQLHDFLKLWRLYQAQEVFGMCRFFVEISEHFNLYVDGAEQNIDKLNGQKCWR